MKKLTAILLALTLALSLFSGCNSVTAPTTDNPGTGNVVNAPPVDVDASSQIAWEDSYVKVAIDLDPGTFGPFETNNNGRRQTLPEVFECLAQYQGHGGEVKGVLAKDWYAVDGEENTYIIELYDYIYDSIGNHLTADDIIFSFEAGLKAFKRYLGCIETIEAVNDYTLKLKLNSSDVGTLEHILCMCWVCDQDSYEASADGMAYEPVGTGPYKVVNAVEGSKVVMEARDDYWQTDESLRVNNQFQNAKTIEFIVVTESSQKAILLETGEVDVVSGMSYEQASQFMNNENYNVIVDTDNKARTLVFNCNEASVCSNLALRQAILYAIDSEGLLAGFDNAGEVAYAIGNSTYPDIYAAWDDGNYYAFDQAKAKELLKEAGYEKGVKVRLLTDTSEMNGKIANILEGYLSQIGIDLEIMQFEETLAKTYMRDFTFFDIYLVYNGTPDYAITMWNERLTNETYDNGLNYCGINDETLQEMLVKTRDVANYSEETMTELNDYISDHAYIYALFSPYVYTVSNKNMTDVCLTAEMWMVPGCNTYVWNK